MHSYSDLHKIHCLYKFRKIMLLGDWGARIYVTWFTVSNFLAPLIALSFYYTKICGKIRRNLQAKKRMLPRIHYSSTSSNSTNNANPLQVLIFQKQQSYCPHFEPVLSTG